LNTKFISADGHVVEPFDLWTTRLDKRFRDRAPQVMVGPQHDTYVIDKKPAFQLGPEGGMVSEKAEKGEIETDEGFRMSDNRPGAADPIARLADQDLDNISAEVIYPGGLGLATWYFAEPELRLAIDQVYNDWISEFISTNPKRLLGAAMLPMGGPIEWSIKEAQRVAKKGVSSFCIVARNHEHPYWTPDNDPLWAALEEIGLPLAFHQGVETCTEQERASQASIIDTVGEKSWGFFLYDKKIGTVTEALGALIWGAVPQRFPKLKFVGVEGGIGWIACALRLFDHWWEAHHKWMKPKLDEPPSFYFKRNFWATFEDDRAGVLTRELMGVDRLMWGSDYPHIEGTFPRSREQIAKDFADVPENEKRMMVGGNAARLYGLVH
jgi:uncharacterized protein